MGEITVCTYKKKDKKENGYTDFLEHIGSGDYTLLIVYPLFGTSYF